MPDLVKVRRALISVSDKAGIERFARGLLAHGVEIVSTGGTAKLLAAAGLPVTPIDQLTGFPEMMDGRVKTLHPKVHGGLLAIRDNAEHRAAMSEHGIEPIDLLCVSLYPFEETIAREGVADAEAIEQIDIGGPAMIRSGSKNHAAVAVITSPTQYGPVLAEMEVTDGCTSLEIRRQLAGAAFARTAEYDGAIAEYLRGGEESRETRDASREGGGGGGESRETRVASREASFPEVLRVELRRIAMLRYGENPHQLAAVYVDPAHSGPSVITARQLHGKELSYNNLNDGAAALDLAAALRAQAGVGGGRFAACVIKHANPCGAAVAGSCLAAVDQAIAGDPLAAFGGILALAGQLDLSAAERLCAKDIFLEVLIAEGFEAEAEAALKARWQNLRMLATGPLESVPPRELVLKPIRGGALAQTPDELAPAPQTWTHAAGPMPTVERLAQAAAIEVMVRAMTSNAIAIGGPIRADDPGAGVRLYGGGLGQVDRVTACRIAAEKAGPLARGAIAVSDAFFPFADGPQVLIDAGVTMIVHTGGSKRDQETFDLCGQRGVTCMVTGVRRFRH